MDIRASARIVDAPTSNKIAPTRKVKVNRRKFRLQCKAPGCSRLVRGDTTSGLCHRCAQVARRNPFRLRPFERTVQRCITLAPAVARELDAWAARTQTSKSQFISRAIGHFVAWLDDPNRATTRRRGAPSGSR
jgi:hypothetical protein